MNDAMIFPETVEEFMESYKMTDTEHIYSNGIQYVPIFRMKQWFEHIKGSEEKRTGWIKTSERLPEKDDECPETVIMYVAFNEIVQVGFWDGYKFTDLETGFRYNKDDVPYWMPLPEPPEVDE